MALPSSTPTPTPRRSLIPIWRRVVRRVAPIGVFALTAPFWVPEVARLSASTRGSATPWEQQHADAIAAGLRPFQDSLSAVFGKPAGGLRVQRFDDPGTFGEYLPIDDAVLLNMSVGLSAPDARQTLAHEFGHVLQSRLGPELAVWWKQHRIRRATRGYAKEGGLREHQAEAISQALLFLIWTEEWLRPTAPPRTQGSPAALDSSWRVDSASQPAHFNPEGAAPGVSANGEAATPEREAPSSSGPDSAWFNSLAFRSLLTDWPRDLVEPLARLQHGPATNRVAVARQVAQQMERFVPGSRQVARLLLSHPQLAGHPWAKGSGVKELETVLRGGVLAPMWDTWPAEAQMPRPATAPGQVRGGWLVRASRLLSAGLPNSDLGVAVHTLWPETSDGQAPVSTPRSAGQGPIPK